MLVNQALAGRNHIAFSLLYIDVIVALDDHPVKSAVGCEAFERRVGRDARALQMGGREQGNMVITFINRPDLIIRCKESQQIFTNKTDMIKFTFC